MIFKKYLYPIVLAVIHFLITTICKIDMVFFNYPNIETSHMILIKILYFAFLLFGYTFLFNVIKKIKEKDSLYIRGFKLFCIYFSIILIVTLLVWPGLWSWDDVSVLESDSHYKYMAWQHILTSFKDLVFLQILPFFGGIIIIQNLIISICVAFSVVKLENTYNIFLKNKVLDYVFKLLPFFLLPVLRYQLSGYRMGLYVYFEAVMLIMLFCSIKNKEKWNAKYCSLFVFLAILCTVWRSESLLYMPVIAVLLFFMKHTGSLKKRLTIIFLIFAGVFYLNAEQKYYLGNSNYEIMSTMRQCAKLIHISNKNDDKELLGDINKVVNIQIVYDNPNMSGDVLYWQKNVVQNNYTKSDYKKYLLALSRLSLKYPETVFKERLGLFFYSSGIKGRTKVPDYSGIINVLSNDENLNAGSPFFVDLGNKFVLNKPISKKIRKETARILTLNNQDFLYRIVWNFLPPIVALFITCLFFLIKKRWMEFILLSSVIGKIFIIILTAPAAFFMYYLSFHMIGYVILIYWLMYLFTLKRGIKNA